ncbi:MAG: hypothetical protein AMJ79_06745 [Phycisphaerae bacterium SM23_30]|nr:MAG: hypothetical protein AMJ79_06745 [Phycisphaerae bacterium SM23_30]
MTVMRWFRKHNKKLMVVIGVIIMVAFGLPSAVFYGRGERDPGKVTVAYFYDSEGNRHEITGHIMNKALRDLDVLRSLGMVDLTRQGSIPQISGLQGVGLLPVLGVNLLLFPDDIFCREGRNRWLQVLFQSNWAGDPEELQELVDYIYELTGSEEGLAGRYYILLSEEAHRAGVAATDEQIQTVKVQFRQWWQSQNLGLTISGICNQFSLPERQFDEVLGNYLAILRYSDMVTRSLAMSEPEIKKSVVNQREIETVNGTFVRFEASLLMDEVPEPNEPDLEAHFEAYKQYRSGEVSEKNKYGFGYLLEDRVELEYLRVDLKEAQEAVKAEFKSLSPREREGVLQQYWQANRERFRIETAPATADTEAQYRDPSYDEVAGQVREMREQEEAYQWAERLLAQAKQKSQKVLNLSVLDNLNLKERAERAADYQDLAEQVSEELLNITYGKSEYLDMEGLRISQEFANSFQQRRGYGQLPLEAILFNCAPLHKGVQSRLDDPPVKLYEDIDSVYTQEVVFLVRIINVDKSREPASLGDDGRKGPAGQESIAPVSQYSKLTAEDPNQPQEPTKSLYDKVKEDWKNLQAFELARQRAEEFAEQAAADWEQALVHYNDMVAEDPNDPGALAKTLFEDTLERGRQQMKSNEQYAAQNEQLAELFRTGIIQQRRLLQEAMELAQQRGEESEGLAVLVREGVRSCLVFKDLKVTPPTKQEYQRLKPYVASGLLTSNQGLMTLWYFNPENIEKRHKFETAANE